MRTMTAEETRGGTLLGRAILLLAAAVVVASMMAAMASPALALRHRDSGLNFLCTNASTGEFVLVNGAGRHALGDQGFTCVKADKRR